MDFGQIIVAFCKLPCTDGDEIGSGELIGYFRDEESSLSDVEGKYGFDTVCHVKQGVTGGFASGDAISPEDMRN